MLGRGEGWVPASARTRRGARENEKGGCCIRVREGGYSRRQPSPSPPNRSAGRWVPAPVFTRGAIRGDRGGGAVDTLLEAGIYSFCQLSPSRRPGIGSRVGGKQPTIPHPGAPRPSLYMKVLLFPYNCYLSPVRVPLPNGRGGRPQGTPLRGEEGRFANRPYVGWEPGKGWVPAFARTREGDRGKRNRGMEV